MIQKLRYRARYLLRIVATTLGLCPKCWTHVNYTTKGRPICPQCGR